MPKKIDCNGEKGFFIDEAEMLQLQKKINDLNEKLAIAEGQSKYKLKKLAQIIERKDKKIDQLKSKLKE